MTGRTIFAKIHIELILLSFESKLFHTGSEFLIVVLSLASSDDLTDSWNEAVHVENGTLTIQGELHGTLDVQSGAKAIIIGKQYGTVSVANNAEIVIFGELHGTTNVSVHGTAVVEAHGKLAGTLSNQNHIS